MSHSYPSLASSSRALPLPSIAEDTLHYVLQPPQNESNEDRSTALAVLIFEYVESLLIQPWLWNKDTWELKAVSGHLEGRMRVGDAVDDEWLVVWLLREVSQKWPELVFSIRDTDGEFLLIEAAHELPSWVSPDNANNRLWLQGGHLHLLPLSVQSSSHLSRHIKDEDDENTLTEEDAIAAVRTGKYRAEDRLENAVWQRIQGYPQAMRTHLHQTNAYLPKSIAKALSAKPDLIQRAVEGFYVRDPAQLRAASRMTHFPPSDSTLTSVLMTRAAYAQLQGQVFHPPRVFGHEWTVREGPNNEAERRWRDLGVKISTGFEIMYKEGGRKGRSGESIQVDHDPAYLQYIQNLKKAGFFGDELEGSAKWKEREIEAKKGWNQVRSEDTGSQRASFAFQVDQAISQAQDPVSDDLPREDSDSWLEISPDELDGMLANISGKQVNGESGKVELGEEHGQALGDLAKKVEEFVGGQGDLQGARFIDELSDEDFNVEEDEDSDSEDLTQAQKDDKVKNLVAPLSEGEWGRKESPAESSKAASSNPNTAKSDGKQASKSEPDVKMRPRLFAKQQYDGVESDSDDSDDELPPAGTIGRKIAEMKWDGAKFEELERAAAKSGQIKGLGDDIDEQMEKRVWGSMDDEPQIVELDENEAGDGNGDIDMGENEEADFLTFSREILGISDEQWEGILSTRRDRGAFVPSNPVPDVPPFEKQIEAQQSKQKETQDELMSPVAGDAVNMNLDSFDKVMQAMDAELAKKKRSVMPATSSGKAAQKPSKPLKTLDDLPKEGDFDDMSDSELAAMDRELRTALKGHGVNVDEMDDDDPDEIGQLDEDGRREYGMMKDFLESYRSQAGQSGVVGNLFGRLGEELHKQNK